MDDNENDVMAAAVLAPVQLYTACDVNQFQFQTTEDLESFEVGIGQSRAVDAIRFGVRMPGEGYNLYVLGAPGSGRHSMARRLLQKEGTSSFRKTVESEDRSTSPLGVGTLTVAPIAASHGVTGKVR